MSVNLAICLNILHSRVYRKQIGIMCKSNQNNTTSSSVNSFNCCYISSKWMSDCWNYSQFEWGAKFVEASLLSSTTKWLNATTKQKMTNTQNWIILSKQSAIFHSAICCCDIFFLFSPFHIPSLRHYYMLFPFNKYRFCCHHSVALTLSIFNNSTEDIVESIALVEQTAEEIFLLTSLLISSIFERKIKLIEIGE